MTPSRLYLLAIAALYAAFAAWCTVKPRATAASLGYELPGPSGLCEYRVVYGGLELGLALFFVIAAFRGSMELSGLWLSLLMHGSLVVFRSVIIATTSGLSSVIYAVFGLEVLLALAAAFLAIPRGLP